MKKFLFFLLFSLSVFSTSVWSISASSDTIQEETLVNTLNQEVIPTSANISYSVVDFSTGTLRVLNSEGQITLETKVVLPRKEFYPVPAVGIVTRSEIGPTWTPTPNMHKNNPGKYKMSYKPYEKGNAMGLCKISMDFSISGDEGVAGSDPLSMSGIRIHGNASLNDLTKRKSSGCIRIPDNFCKTLVENLPPDSFVYFVGKF